MSTNEPLQLPYACRHWYEKIITDGKDRVTGHLLVNERDWHDYYNYIRDQYKRMPLSGDWGLWFKGWEVRPSGTLEHGQSCVEPRIEESQSDDKEIGENLDD